KNTVTTFQYNDSTKQYTITSGTTIQTLAYGTDNQAGTEDDVFLKVQFVNADGETLVQELDAEGRVTKITNVTKNEVTNFSYNNTTRKYTVTSGTTIQTLSYGIDNQPGTDDDELLRVQSVNEEGDTILQELDPVSRRVTKIINQTKNIETVFQYNDSQKKYTITSGATIQILAYGTDNQSGTEDDVLLTVQFVNEDGETILQELDNQNRVSKITNVTKNTVTTFQYNDTTKQYTITSGTTKQTLAYGPDNQAGTDDDLLLSVESKNDDNDQIIQELDNQGRLLKLTNVTKNTVTTFVYNDAAKTYLITTGTTKQTLSYGPDNQAGTEDDLVLQVEFVTDAGEKLIQEFNTLGRIVKLTNVTKNTVTAFQYNDSTKQFAVTTGSTIQTIGYGPDAEPNTDDDIVLSTDQISEQGDSITQQLDAQGRVIKITNNTKNIVTTFQYNDAAKTYTITSGTTIQTLSYGTDNQAGTDDDLLLQVQFMNSDGETLIQEINPQGRVTKITNQTKNVITTFLYNDSTKRYTITTGDTVQTLSYGTDNEPGTDDDLVIEVISKNQDGDTLRQELDNLGRVTKITNQTKNTVTTFQYNDATKTYTITSGTTIQTLGYGADNEAGTEDDVFLNVAFVSEEGDSLTQELDPQGRMTIQTLAYGTDNQAGTEDDVFLKVQFVNADGETMMQELDAEGRVTKITNVTKNEVTNFSYNNATRKYTVTSGTTIQTLAYGIDNQAGTDDDALLTVQFVNEDGDTILQELDPVTGRVTTITNVTKNIVTTFQYNDAQKKYTITSGATIQILGYGTDNQAGTEDDVLLTVQFVNEDGETILQEIDSQNRVAKITNVTKNIVSTFQYNDATKQYTVISGTTKQTLSYGPDNQAGTDDDVLLKVESSNDSGDQIIQELDNQGRLLKLTNITKNEVTTFAYDDNAKKYTVTSGTTKQTLSYGLDNQAGTDDDLVLQVEFVSDAGDKLIQELNSLGRIVKLTNVTKNTVTTFIYNDSAKRFTVTTGSTVQTIGYGPDGEPNTDDDILISAEQVNDEGDSITQELDTQGRVSKITNNTKNTVTTFQYNDSTKQFTVTSGTTIQTLSYGADNEPNTDDDLLLQVQFVNSDGETLIQELNPQGRVTKITNVTKNVITTFLYNDLTKRYTITTSDTVQTLSYGTDNEPGTDDDLVIEVVSKNQDGDTLRQELDNLGRVIKITNITKDTITTFQYNDVAKTYTITSGTTIQTLGYGADNEAGTEDDVFLNVVFVSEEGDSLTQELDPQGRVIKITNNTKNTVTAFQYNDATKTYTVTSGTTIQTLAYGADNLAGTEDDVFLKVQFVNADGEIMVQDLDAQGRVTQITNVTKNEITTFSYNNAAKQYTVTSGTTIQTISYGPDNLPGTDDDSLMIVESVSQDGDRLIQELDMSGRVTSIRNVTKNTLTTFQYNESEKKYTATSGTTIQTLAYGPDNQGGTEDDVFLTVQFVNEDGDTLIQEFNSNERVIKITNVTKNTVTTFQYNDQTKIYIVTSGDVTQHLTYGLDNQPGTEDDLLVLIQDRQANQTIRVNYDNNLNVISQDFFQGIAESAGVGSLQKIQTVNFDANGVQTVQNFAEQTFQKFDAQNRLIETGRIDTNGVRVAQQTFEYGTAGRVLAKSTDGTYQSYEYDAAKNEIGKLVESGIINAQGIRTAQQTYDYGTAGRVAVTNTDGTYQSYEYNAADNEIGKLVESGIVNTQGIRTAQQNYDYGTAGRVAVTNTDGTYQSYEYNAADNEIGKLVESGIVNTQGIRTAQQTYDYSTAGRVAVTNTDGTYQSYEYDAAENQIGKLVESGAVNAQGIRTAQQNYDYGVPGRVAVTNPDGTYQSYEYNAAENEIGKLVESGLVNTQGIRTAQQNFNYETAGQVSVSNADGTYQTYEFDASQNEIGKLVESGTVNAQGIRTAQQTYDYATAGRVAVTNTDGTYQKYEYDAANNEIGRLVEAGVVNAQGIRMLQQTYDYGLSNRVTVGNTDGTYQTYEFDAAQNQIGRLVESGALNVQGAKVVQNNYDYNVPDRVTITGTDNNYQTYEFNSTENEIGRILEAGKLGTDQGKIPESTYDYGVAGETSVRDLVNQVTNVFDGQNKLLRHIDKNNITTFFESGIIKSIVDANGIALRSYQLNFDPNTNQILGAEFAGSSVVPATFQIVDPQLSRRIHQNGVTQNFITENSGKKQFVLTDILGIAQIGTDENGKPVIYFNTGTVVRYKADPAGTDQNVIDQIINLQGRIQYQIRSANDLPANTPADAPYRAFLNSDASDVDISLLKDNSGYIVYKKDGNGKTMLDANGQEIIDFSVEFDGTARFYIYNDDGNVDLDRIVEREKYTTARDGKIITETIYQDQTGHINHILTYNRDGAKIVQRSDYRYDDSTPPDPDRVEQYDVTTLTDSEIRNPALLSGRTNLVPENTIFYRLSSFDPEGSDQLLIDHITDKHGNISTYTYTAEGFIQSVEQKDSGGRFLSLTKYEQGPFYNDRVKSVTTPTRHQIFHYNSQSELIFIDTYKIVNEVDVAGQPGDDEIESSVHMDEQVPALEFNYREGSVSGYRLTAYNEQGLALYTDEYAVRGAADITWSAVQAKIDESTTDSIDTVQEGFDALWNAAGVTHDDRRANRTYFDANGVRPVYAVALNANGEAARLSEFHYDNRDADLQSIDQWNIRGNASFAALPSNSQTIQLPPDSSKLDSTVYFDEGGERTEFSVNYRYVESQGQLARQISDYTVFGFAADASTVIYTDNYEVRNDSEITAERIQSKIAESPTDNIRTIREAINSLLADSSRDDVQTSRVFVDDQQNPILNLTLNTQGYVESVLTYHFDSQTGTLVYIDSHRMKDSDNNPDNGLTLVKFDPASMNSPTASVVAALYETNQFSTRTFVDEDSNPSIVMNISENQKISSLSKLGYNAEGQAIFTDSPKMLIKNQSFTSQNYDTLAEITAAAGTLYHADAIDSRTFLDASGNPVMNLTVNAENKVSGISKLFDFDSDGDLDAVDNLKLVEPPSSFNAAAMKNPVSVAGLIASPEKIESRTFLDANGNPVMSLTIDAEGKVSGISKLYDFDNDGDLDAVDSLKLVQPISPFNGAAMKDAASVAGLIATPEKVESRTFLDADSNPVMSLTVDSEGKVSGISKLYDFDHDGDLDAVDNLKLTSTTTAFDQNAMKSPAVPSVVALIASPEKIETRTFLDADGNPVMSLTIDAEGKVSGISKLFDFDSDGDLDAVDSLKLVQPISNFNAASMKDPGNVANLIATPEKVESRTFLDAQGNPTMSLTIDAEGKVSGISKLYDFDADGDLDAVDSLKLAQPISSFNAATMKDAASTANLLAVPEKVESRTFLDAQGNPVMSLTIDESGKVSGISKLYDFDADGDLDAVDSLKLAQPISSFNVETMKDPASVAELIASPEKVESRTFLDAQGNPVMSLTIDSEGKVSGISKLYDFDNDGDLDAVDSLKLAQPISSFNSATMKDPASVANLIATPEKVESRTFLDANGNPVMSLTIDSEGKVSGISKLFDFDNDGDLDAVDSLKLAQPISNFNAATMKDPAAVANLIATPEKVESRTFLDANGNPVMSLTVDAGGKVSGISKLYDFDNDGDLDAVDSLKLAQPISNFNAATMKDPAAVANLIATPEKVESRTFLDANGNPVMSLTIDAEGKVSGISKLYDFDADGDLDAVDSLKLVQPIASFNAGTMKDAASVANLIVSPEKIEGRTFLDADGNPVMSLTIDAQGKVSGISKLYDFDKDGDLDAVDSLKLTSTTTTFDQNSMKAPASSAVTALIASPEKVESRTFLDANGNPVMSLTIDAEGKVSGISKLYDFDNDGDLDAVDSLELAQPIISFNASTMKEPASVVNLIASPEKVESRTFLDANGNPIMSLTIDTEGKVAGISKLYDFDNDGDLDAVDSLKLAQPIVSFNASTMKDPASVANLIATPEKVESRTFLDANGNPSMSLTIDAEGRVSSISRLYDFDNDGDLDAVDSLKLAQPISNFNAGTMKDAASVANLIAAPEKVENRTFLDADGNPVMSLAIDELGKVSGISKLFDFDNDGDLDAVDSLKLAQPLSNFNAATMKDAASVANLIASPEKIENRTFLDANGSPIMSLTIDEQGKVSSISKLYDFDSDGDLDAVDSLKLVQPISNFNAGTMKDPASVANLIASPEKVESRTFLDANGNPVMSLAIDAESKVSGISKLFDFDSDGDLDAVDSLKLAQPISNFNAATMKNAASVANLIASPEKIESRTFLDANGNPVMSLTIDAEGKVSGISKLFDFDSDGDLDAVDSL
ncbi:MAG: RHS repeat protein, partial [Candidatus Omnitrophica bacterium]|nr:RHS repeat protein [Candidatus Omnitrophota bacterium]